MGNAAFALGGRLAASRTRERTEGGVEPLRQLPQRPRDPLGDFDLEIEELVARNPNQLSFNEYRYIKDHLLATRPARLLVFGLGNDSDLWARVNRGGRTLFLEDCEDWIAQVRARFSQGPFSIEKVAYGTRLDEWKRHLVQPASLGRPPVSEGDWDAIIVDGPLGFDPLKHPGRTQSMFWAAGLASQGRRRSTDVFVHDFDRVAERMAAWRFLGRSRLVGTFERLAHFRVPGRHWLRSMLQGVPGLGSLDERFFNEALAAFERTGLAADGTR
jgi:hypothetical protein